MNSMAVDFEAQILITRYGTMTVADDIAKWL